MGLGATVVPDTTRLSFGFGGLHVGQVRALFAEYDRPLTSSRATIDRRLIDLGVVDTVPVRGGPGSCTPVTRPFSYQPTGPFPGVDLRSHDHGFGIDVRRFGTAWVRVDRVHTHATRRLLLPGLGGLDASELWQVRATGACRLASSAGSRAGVARRRALAFRGGTVRAQPHDDDRRERRPRPRTCDADAPERAPLAGQGTRAGRRRAPPRRGRGPPRPRTASPSPARTCCRGRPSSSPELEALGVATHCLDVRDERDVRWAARLHRLLRERTGRHPARALAVPGRHRAARRRRAPRRARPRLVYTLHNTWNSFATPTRWLNASTMRRDAADLAVSELSAPPCRPACAPGPRSSCTASTSTTCAGTPTGPVRAPSSASGRTRSWLGPSRTSGPRRTTRTSSRPR